MSQYKVYPAYKDSGIEWIGQVPEHWKLRKVAWDLVMSIGWTPDTKNYRYYGGEYNWVSIADLTKNRVKETNQKITQLAVDEMKGSQAPAGSVLFSYKLTIGMVALLDEPAYTNEAIAAFYPNQNISMQFWKYAAVVILPKYSRKNIYNSDLLNQELMNSARFYAPSYDEQEVIAAALDHETARIDALIEKKNLLIELLKEKRQALITHAVTKGLDPNVKMKDSGIEWIGQVPEHWVVKPICRVVSVNDDVLHDNTTGETTIRYVDISSVGYMEGINQALDMRFSDAPSRARRKASSGDVIISTVRTYLKAIAAVTDEYADCVFSTGFAILRARHIDRSFIKWMFLNDLLVQAIESHSEGLSYPAINPSTLVKLKSVIPPPEEQVSIAATLDRETARIDALVKKIEQSITLLKERRSAFITAAVTGQIDLRGEQ